MFYFSNFRVSGFYIKVSGPFEFIFVQSERTIFFLLPVTIQFFRDPSSWKEPQMLGIVAGVLCESPLDDALSFTHTPALFTRVFVLFYQRSAVAVGVCSGIGLCVCLCANIVLFPLL